MKIKIGAVSGLIVLIGAVVFSACNKYDEIGTGILPVTDNLDLIYTDTATINAFTVREDSLRTNGFTGFPVSSNIIGSSDDPVFGRHHASAYMQLNLSKFNFSFGPGSMPDSLILCLALTSFYGDTTAPIHFKIYRMDEVINEDSAYYSNKSLRAATLIGDAIVTVNPKDSLSEFGVKKAPHIRIPLNLALASELMSKSGKPEYSNDTAFVNYFNGIYITAESTTAPGCMYIFDYKNTQSKLALYYKFSVDSDSLAFNYVFDELARFNHFDHNYYAGSEVNTALTNNTTGSNYVYVQSMAGVKTKIILPEIKNMFAANPSLVLNNAVLVFKAESNLSYATHTSMALAYVDSNGKSQSFSPDNNEATNSTNGLYIASSSEYRFNITRYLTQVMTGKRTDYGIYLRGSAAIINAYHTRIYGTANPQGRIKLELTYTKF